MNTASAPRSLSLVWAILLAVVMMVGGILIGMNLDGSDASTRVRGSRTNQGNDRNENRAATGDSNPTQGGDTWEISENK